MLTFSLSEFVEGVGGRLRGPSPEGPLRAVSTDSRAITGGEVFFAIRGERFDGHDFVDAALAAGAALAVVETGESPGAGPVVEVPDVAAALSRLAASHRRRLKARVIAVVGSNGKTTTKGMIDHVLAGRFRGRCSPRSYNNHIGVPLTLLAAEADDEYLVVEIGTNHPGEVAVLGAVVRPDEAVITNVGEEHLEGLGDLEGVANEECSILAALRPGGFAAVNVDSPLVRKRLDRGVGSVTFGLHASADLRVTDARYEPPALHFKLNDGSAWRTGLPGTHNAVNAAGAIAVARHFGCTDEEIAKRLAAFEAPPMRGQVSRMGEVTVIDDTYNANPPSALAAVDVLRTIACAGRRIAVFGEMCELGESSAVLHQRVAESVGRDACDLALLVGRAGELMYDGLRRSLGADRVKCCDDCDACTAWLEGELRAGDVVLLKASRAVALDRVVAALRERREAAAAVAATAGADVP